MRPLLSFRAMRTLLSVLLLGSLAACDGLQYRRQAREVNPAINDADYQLIAVATFKLIDPKGNIKVIVIPPDLDARRKDALKGIAKLITSSDDPDRQGYTLPADYFSLQTFSIEDGVATIEGQLGPVTGAITSVGLRDCGKIFNVGFYLEDGDWASHSYKIRTCDQLRVWWPVDSEQPH
jgi:hypothetical protein